MCFLLLQRENQLEMLESLFKAKWKPMKTDEKQMKTEETPNRKGDHQLRNRFWKLLEPLRPTCRRASRAWTTPAVSGLRVEAMRELRRRLPSMGRSQGRLVARPTGHTTQNLEWFCPPPPSIFARHWETPLIPTCKNDFFNTPVDVHIFDGFSATLSKRCISSKFLS